MKKVMLICLVLLSALSHQAFAKAGIADGGPAFVLTIFGLLLIVAGIFEGIDYLKKNGKALFKRFRTFLRKHRLTPGNSH